MAAYRELGDSMGVPSQANVPEDILALAPLQEGILFHHINDDAQGDHIAQGIIELTGSIDRNILQHCVDSLVARHGALRSVFIYENVKKPRQVILRNKPCNVEFHDQSDAVNQQEFNRGKSVLPRAVMKIAAQEARREFDLTRDPLLRLCLISSDRCNYLVITNHHIALDGWSLGVLLGELLELYWAKHTGNSPKLVDAGKYADFIRWVNEQVRSDGLEYYRNYLTGYHTLASFALASASVDQKESLHTDLVSDVDDATFGVIDHELDEDISESLRNLATNRGLTLNSVMTAGWGVLLQKYADRSDVVFGNVVSGRHPEVKSIESMVGLMVNTAPIRCTTTKQDSFSDVARKIQNDIKQSERHSYLQLADISQQYHPRSRLFDNILTFENFPLDDDQFEGRYRNLGFKITGRTGADKTSYKLSVTITPARRLRINVVFRSDSYSERQIVQLTKHFGQLLKRVCKRPDLPLFEIGLLTDEEIKFRLETQSRGWTSSVADLQYVDGHEVDAEHARYYVLDQHQKFNPPGTVGQLYRVRSTTEVRRNSSVSQYCAQSSLLLNPHDENEVIQATGLRGYQDCAGRITVVAQCSRGIAIGDTILQPEVLEHGVCKHPLIAACRAVVRGVGDAGNAALAIDVYYTSDQPLPDSLTRRLISQMLEILPSNVSQLEFRRTQSLAEVESTSDSGLAVEQLREHSDTEAKADGAGILLSSAQEQLLSPLLELFRQVLNAPQFKAEDDFFDNGGNSLLALRLMLRIKKGLQVKLAVEEIFDSPTPIALSAVITQLLREGSDSDSIKRSQSSKESVAASIQPAMPKPHYPVTSQQRRMFALQQFDINNTAYNMPDAFLLRGALNVDKLCNAFDQIVNRHESLRTTFQIQDEQLVQVVHEKVEFRVEQGISTIALGDERGNVERDKKKSVELLLNAFVRPFDLARGPMVRATLVPVGLQEHVLLIDLHHIVTDGVSIEQLVTELVAFYTGESLEKQILHYKDYAQWSLSEAGLSASAVEREFWINQFKQPCPVVNLPYDYKRPAVRKFDGSDHRFELGANLTSRIKKYCNRTRMTPFMFMLAIYKIAIARYAGADDIVVGTPVSGRDNADLDGVVGMFVNTLAIRSRPTGEKSFADYAEEIRSLTLKAFEHQGFALEELIDALNLNRDISRNPLFDVLFVFDDKVQPVPQLPGVSIELVQTTTKVAKFDLVFAVLDDDDSYGIYIEYCTALFNAATIERFASHVVQLIDRVLISEQQPIGELEIVSDDERDWIENSFNATDVPVVDGASIDSAFARRVAEYPHKPAVVYESQSLSYQELNDRAERLAQILTAQGVSRGSVVGLMVEKSLEMVVGIFGIIKAGAAYLPIDREYPAHRVSMMLDENDCRVVVLSGAKSNSPSGFSYPICFIDLDEKTDNVAACASPKPAEIAIDSDSNRYNDVAYIIYTSGSSGQPKGIMIEHGNVLNLVAHFKTLFGPDAVVTQFAPFTFDASAGEIFTTLLTGATLHLISNEVINDVREFEAYLHRHGITFTALPPPYLANVDPHAIPNLHTVLAAGSSSSEEVIQRWSDQAVYINAYGPTETTVISTQWRSDKDEPGSNLIGRPIANTRVYVVNESLRQQPIGVIGEICIAGDGVARGYVNREQLDRQAFASLPDSDGQRVYRTGDLGRLTADGRLEFIGRRDDQVKVRGYRIELSEIEICVDNLESIQAHAVVATKVASEDTEICLYYVPADSIGVRELRTAIGKELPAYMVPTRFVELAELPLTPNGKVDKKRLPDPSVEQESAVEKVDPRNEIETSMVRAWQAVLNVSDVGIDDDFFANGGDSIKAIQIAARLNTEGYKLDVAKLFQYPTAREISRHVERRTIEIDQGEVQGEFPFTAIQHWFSAEQFTDAHHWNQSAMLFRASGFSTEHIKETFKRLLAHHDVLRSTPDFERLTSVHQAPEDLEFPLWTFDLTTISEPEERINRLSDYIHKLIRFNKPPLLHLALFRTNVGDHLLIVIHHFLVDGVSWRILFEDFLTAYKSCEEAKPTQFPPKTHSYKHWAQASHEYAKTPALQRDYEYFIQQSKKPLACLPGRQAAALRPTLRDVATVDLALDISQSQRFLNEANSAFTTEVNDLLLSALTLSLGWWIGTDDPIILNLEGHGRENIVEGLDVSRTVGWFTCQYPVVLGCCDSADSQVISNHIVNTKESLRAVPMKGISFGIGTYLLGNENTDDVEDVLARPEISFNYLGEFNLSDDSSDIQLSTLAGGTEFSPDGEQICAININGQYIDGQLAFSVDYDLNRFDSATMQQFARHFQQALSTVADTCISRERSIRTPSDYSAQRLTRSELEEIETRFAVADLVIEDIHNLTPMQSGMLYHYLLDENRGDYHVENSMIITGDIDASLLERSFNDLVVRHEALRTAVVHEKLQQPRQVVFENRPMPFLFENISDLSDVEQDRTISSALQSDWDSGFDLSDESLLRVRLFQTGEDSAHLTLFGHHIMMDGWCLGPMFDDLMDIYRTHLSRRPLNLGAAPSYGDFLNWLAAQDVDRAMQYWAEYLADYEQTEANLFSSGDESGPAQEAGEYVNCTQLLKFDQSTTDRLNAFARAHRVTVNSIMQAAWALVLQACADRDDVVFGNVISGRPTELSEVERIIGLFVNTIPFRVITDEEDTFETLVKRVQQEFKNCEKHGHVSMAEIASTALAASAPSNGPERDGASRIVDHLFVFENFPLDELGSGEDDLPFSVRVLEGKEQISYDFNVMVVPGDCLTVKFIYNSSRVESEKVERFSRWLDAVVVSVIDSPSRNLIDLNPMSTLDVESINRFNATQHDRLIDLTIPQMVDRWVSRSPESVAISAGSDAITYAQLNLRINHLANRLQILGVKADQPVALMTDRSIEMVVGMLAIMKAGGAYLPIAPDLPEERKLAIFEDSQCQLLLTQSRFETGLSTVLNVELIDLYGQSGFDINVNEKCTVFDSHVDCRDLAYIIYTSGSTGRPKGVMIEHRSVVNRLLWMVDHYGIDSNDVFLQKTTYTFDVSVWELFMPLITGGILRLLAPGDERHPEAIAKELHESKISVVHFVPSMLSAFVHSLPGKTLFHSLRRCFCSGEALSVYHKNRFFEKVPGVELHNLYGPTEAAIEVSNHEVTPQDQRVPIGKPIDNTRLYVLDRHGRNSPIGVCGELHIAGVQVARGYVNRIDLTQEKFVKDPFMAGERMYKTGDIARWNANGEVEYLGRLDHQVKVRGFRIELGEVESCLLSHAEINDAVVTAIPGEDGYTGLCAYYCAKGPIERDELDRHLGRSLPDYMLPSVYMQLDELPINSSGKCDRKKLPSPFKRELEYGIDSKVNLPENELEFLIQSVWQEAIGEGAIGVTESFHARGGNSLSAIKAVSMLLSHGYRVSILDLYKAESIRGLAQHIAATDGVADDPIHAKEVEVSGESVQAACVNATATATPDNNDEPRFAAVLETVRQDVSRFQQQIIEEPVSRHYPLSPIQRLHIADADRVSGGVIELLGYRQDEYLKRAVDSMVARQGLLRSQISEKNTREQWKEYSAGPNAPVPYVDLTHLTNFDANRMLARLATHLKEDIARHVRVGFREQCAKERSGIDDDSLRLPYVLVLVKTESCRHHLLFGADHLITDASSLDVIRRSISDNYQQRLRSNVTELGTDVAPQKRQSYATYVENVLKGPQDTGPAELVEKFEISEFGRALDSWVSFCERWRSGRYISFDFSVNLNAFVDTRMRSPLLAALVLFSQLSSRLSSLSQLPLTVLMDTRSNIEGRYFDVVGEFLDHMPMFLDDASTSDLRHWENVLETIQTRKRWVVEHNVNFLSFLTGMDEEGGREKRWGDIGRQLYPASYADSLLRFNFQGESPERIDQIRVDEGCALITSVKASSGVDDTHKALNGFLGEIAYRGAWLDFTIDTNLVQGQQQMQRLLDDVIAQMVDTELRATPATA